MNFLIRLLISTFAIILSAYILPGVHVDSFLTALVVAAVLAFLNSIVKPVMILLTIPVTIFSFGLFLLFINGFIIVIADKLIDGFEVRSYGWAFLFSVLLWFVTQILESFQSRKEDEGN